MAVAEKMSKEEKRKIKDMAKKEKMLRKERVKTAEARGALFLLHWHSAVTPPATAELAAVGMAPGADVEAKKTRQFLMGLEESMQQMEKVSKVGGK